MVNKLKSVFKIFLRDKFLQSSVFVVVLATSTSFFVFGAVSAVIIFLAYLCGYVTSNYIFIYSGEIINALSSVAKTLKSNREKHAKPLKCNICGDKNCNKEKIVHKQKPWAGLMVPEEIDAACENLLDRTLNEFVGSWYKNVSVDDCFPGELRYNIRYGASVFLSKALKVNIGNLITKKLLPALLRHIELCRQLKQGKTTLYHPALYNRESELNYLRYKVKEILPHLLEKPQLECSMFTMLVVEILAGWVLLPLASTADPSVLNSLLHLMLAPSLSVYPPAAASSQTEFLAHFSHSSSGLHTNTALLPDMCSVFKDKTLLQAFMQFLKDQGAVHILQFCLDVEEFNQRMLSPELKSEELDLLYRDAWDLYSVYFSPHSPDNIGFASHLVMSMRKVLSKDVTKLRTSPPLFQAYEHAYSLLDKTYCPLFHTSDEFYMWLCGPRTSKNQNKSGSSSPSVPGSPAKFGKTRKSTEGGTVLKLSNRVQKIKGALRSQTVLDGQTYDPNPLPLEAGAEFGEELSEEEVERDMSSWKVKICSAESRLDPSIGKLGPVFIINVQTSPNGDGGEWTVERRLADFYSLEAKLTEFHGEFTDNRLPPSGILSPSPPTQPQVYEGYLDKLLRMPSLRGSDLLHWFLSSPVEFVVEDNGLGKLLKKSVGPLSLRKERGQNIEPFIATYLAATETKGKNKLEWKDFTYELSPRKKRCLTNTVFKNNLGLDVKDFPVQNKDKILVPKLSGSSDCFLYIGLEIMKLPGVVMRILTGFLSLFKQQVDVFCSYYIERRIFSLLVPQRVAHLINLLQWVVYDKQTKSDPVEVRKNVKEKIDKMKGYSSHIYKNLFDTFQDPVMNKQLFYTLFDHVIDEIFHEKPKI